MAPHNYDKSDEESALVGHGNHGREDGTLLKETRALFISDSDSESVDDLDQGHQDDIVIAVMGSTGTGKSSFTRLLSGDPSIIVGDSLESETSDVQAVRFLDSTSGRGVVIVDTPGFDDSRAGTTDTDVLKKITEFLLTVYDKDRKLNGLIYVQRISDPRFGGQSSRNLRMFRNLCGTNAYQNVVILTTFWDRLATKAEGKKREVQLRTQFFQDLTKGGARFMRHNRTIESAHQVLRHLLTLVPTNVQIQEEIRLKGIRLEDTAAGSVHREEVERMIEKHNREVAGLKAEMDAIQESNKAAIRELEEERVKLERGLARWEAERAELMKGLDEAGEDRKRLEAAAEEERKCQEKWRQDQENKWKSEFDTQKEKHDESMQRLHDQLDREKKAREDMDLEQERRLREETMKVKSETLQWVEVNAEMERNEKWRQEQAMWKSQFGSQSARHREQMLWLQDHLEQERKAREKRRRKKARQRREEAVKAAVEAERSKPLWVKVKEGIVG